MTPATAPPSTDTPNTPAKRVQYNAMAPVGSAANLKALLESQKDSMAMALPRHVTPDRLIKTMLVAANRVPDLLQCTQASVFETISRAAELGLDLSGTLGEAYPVPFNNKVGDEWKKQCTLIIGYRGLAKLARQSGEIQKIDCDVVCANDTFTMTKGTGGKCEFKPNLRDRGEPIGAFAYVQFKDGGEQYDFMPIEDLEKIRRRSKSGADKQGNPIGAWRSDWAEMAKKTVFRRVAKWLPLSAEKFQQAIEHDSSEFGGDEIIEVTNVPPTARGTRALANKLGVEPPDNASPTLQGDTNAESEPREPGADEDAAPAPDKGPTIQQQLVTLMAGMNNIEETQAEASINAYTRKLFKKPLIEITNVKMLADVEAKIKDNAIKIVEVDD